MKKSFCLILTMLLGFILVSCQKDTVVSFAFKEEEVTIGLNQSLELEYEIDGEHEVEFSLSTNEVVSIEGSEINGLKVGEVIITGQVKGSDVSDTIKVIVKDVKVTSITITGPNEGVIDEEVILSVSVLPLAASFKEIEWKVSNQLYASVDNGTVTLLREGLVTITALIDDVSTTHQITIYKENPTGPFEYELELNGGNMFYANREAVVTDFINDYNEFGNTNYNIETLPIGSEDSLNIHSFLYDVKYRDKWLWLVKYLAAVGSASNKEAAKAMVDLDNVTDFEDLNELYKNLISYEVRGFILGIKYEEDSNYPSSDYSNYDLKNDFWIYLIRDKQATKFISELSGTNVPTNVYRENFIFSGWYDNRNFNGEPVTFIKRPIKLYAKFVESNPVLGLSIENGIEEMFKDDEHKLIVNIDPISASGRELIYLSSNSKVASVNRDGLIVAHNNGEAVITVRVGMVKTEMEIIVFSKDDIELKFSDGFNGYINVGDEFSLDVNGFGKVNSSKTFGFQSVDSSILKLSGHNTFKALKAGKTTIEILDGSDVVYSYQAIVQESLSSSERVDQLLRLLANNNNAVATGLNVIPYYTYQQEWSDPRYESVNAYLFDDFVVDRTTYLNDNPPIKTSGEMSSVEFVLVHDTANLNGGLAMHGDFFLNPSIPVSIHYITGDHGIVQSLPDKYIGWHAGDGTGRKFEWIPTGITAENRDKPVIDLSLDGYFTINGEKSSVLAPKGNDGQILDSSYLTYLGPTWDVFEGEYHLGTTWFATGQQARGVIASHGGNNNSIGIEMAVNTDGDIIDTVQRTAKLVANLLEQYDLDYNRVITHNTTDGKGDPYTLHNTIYKGDWYFDRFMEHVKVEREVLANFSDATITFSSDSQLVSETGRVVVMPEFTTEVEYTITVTIGEVTKSITLVSVIPGTNTWNQNYGFFEPTQAWSKKGYRE